MADLARESARRRDSRGRGHHRDRGYVAGMLPRVAGVSGIRAAGSRDARAGICHIRPGGCAPSAASRGDRLSMNHPRGGGQPTRFLPVAGTAAASMRCLGRPSVCSYRGHMRFSRIRPELPDVRDRLWPHPTDARAFGQPGAGRRGGRLPRRRWDRLRGRCASMAGAGERNAGLGNAHEGAGRELERPTDSSPLPGLRTRGRARAADTCLFLSSR